MGQGMGQVTMVARLALVLLLALAAPVWAYEVWVTNQATDRVLIFDGETLKELAAISTDRKPHNIEFSPDFRIAYVSNVGAGTVAVIDAVERKVIKTIPTGKGAHGVNRSPDGRLLYVTNTQDETVSVIETSSLTIVKTIPVGPVPSVAIFTPDGKKAYIANVSGSLSVIDVEKGDVIKKIPDLDGAIVLAISKDGKKVYVARGFSDKVAVVDTQTDRVRSNISVGKDGHSVWTTPDGKFVWVANRLAKSVSVIDANQDRVIRTIQNVGDKPDILAFSPDGKKAFVGLRGRAETGDPKILSGVEPGLSVVDVASGKVVTKIKLGGDPHGVSVRP